MNPDICAAEWAAVIACAADEPASSYACNDEDEAFIGEEACGDEQSELLGCILGG
jgi:hypothetical protein